MMFFAGHQLLGQENSLDSDHTKTISIPRTYFGCLFTNVEKVSLHKGDVLNVNILEDDLHFVSEDQPSSYGLLIEYTKSKLSSQICYGDNSMSGYFNYLTGLAPRCILLSNHIIGDLETFSYTATDLPGTAYIYFHFLADEGAAVDKWLNTCIEVNVD